MQERGVETSGNGNEGGTGEEGNRQEWGVEWN